MIKRLLETGILSENPRPLHAIILHSLYKQLDTPLSIIYSW